jgi:ADP-heptose:LPS heptosyltransferase
VAVSRGPTLLVLRALGLGDLLTAVPALRALKRAFPRHHRVLAAPAWLEPVALHTGAVDEVRDSAPLAPLAADLSRPDIAVNMHGRGPESHRVVLARSPKRLIAFANAEVLESANGPRWRSDEHEVARWCRLLSESGIPTDPDDLYLEPPAEEPPLEAIGATVIHPGAASPARRWPAARFATVARAEREAGRRVVITGSASEKALAEEVARLAGLAPSSVWAGRTGLQELVALVAGAARVVSGDTGVAHLATALKTPSVLLFGPVAPQHWGPPDRARHIVLWRGHTGDPHADEPDPGLLELGVDDVLEALSRLPEAQRPLRIASQRPNGRWVRRG